MPFTLKASQVAGTVEKLLLKERKHSIEYIGFGIPLTNHVAWVIVSHSRTGRTEEEVNELVERYNKRIGTLPSGPVKEVRDPEEMMHNRQNHESLTAFFDKELEEAIRKEGSITKGISAFTTARLPAVSKGVGAGAFHPMLLFGLGMESCIPCAVTSGLAYMYCDTWREHDEVAVVTGDGKALLSMLSMWCTAVEEAKEIVANPDSRPGGEFQKKTLAMHKRFPLLRRATTVPNEGELLPALHDMFIFAAAVLLASENEFFILHGFTSLWSLYHTVAHDLPYKLKADLVGSWLRAYFVAYAAQGFPGLETTAQVLKFLLNGDYAAVVGSLPRVPSEACWDNCFERAACLLDEEHCFKAVWMLHEVAPLCPPEAGPVFLHTAHRLATHVPVNRNRGKATLRFAAKI
eukprot:TRINITY_DN20035_c0_g1_i1.p1 TRINITY_DN20035_c0_g1~~TRINITY_DN20035_c0_g1_i1.p1  ORF type:complete len:405 (+),score=116.83 TRINITY_DN20035_c0_g1_i1:65-1279(+)